MAMAVLEGLCMVKPTEFVRVVCSVAILTGFARGAEQSPMDANVPQTLPQYLRYAALHNAGLQAAFERWKGALEQVPQAKALPDPRFTYGYFIEEVETRVGPQRQRAGIMQVFPWFGTIEARTDAAAAEAKAAGRRFETAKLQLFYQVKDAFYEYLYLHRAIDIAQENMELSQHFEEVARTRYVASAARHPDIIRAQVQVAILEDKLRELQELRAPIVARLNAVLNRPADASLPWPSRQERASADIEPNTVFDLLKRQNPQLEAKEFELAGAVSRIELAKKRFYPEIGVGADWIDTDEALMSGVEDSGKDPVILMFSMNLPIWRKSYKAAEQQAQVAARRVRHEREDLENSLVARASRILYDYDDSGRKLTLYGDVLVPKAEELVGASESAYMAGTIDFLSLIDAQQTLLQYQLQRERAWATHQQRLAELEMLVGVDLSPAQPAQRED
jgi:cobalt-zinc-cadmium efflux system outer membrane protein